MADALLEYRGKVVRLKPGHSAVLKAYKKKMLGSVKVTVEPSEDGGIVPDGTITIDTPGVHDVSLFKDADVQVLPEEEVNITPSEEVQEKNYDPSKKGIKKVNVGAIQFEEIGTIVTNGDFEAPKGKYFKKFIVKVPAGASASGTLNIYKNGVEDVTDLKYVNVQVLPDENVNVVPTTEPQEINYNAEKKGIKKVTVEAIKTEGLAISANNVTFDEYAKKFSGAYVPTEGSFFNGASLDLPLPNDYLKPVGDFPLTKNGETYDVHRYATATVDLPLDSREVDPSEKDQDITAREGFEALSTVKVKAIQVETRDPVTKNGKVTASTGKYFKELDVNVPIPDGYTVPSGTLPITENHKDFDVTAYAGARVDIEPVLEDKQFTPNDELQEVTPPSGVDGFGKVTVYPVPLFTPPTIVDNGYTTAPSGYYIKSFTVNVPPPADYMKIPSANLPINTLGDHDVLNYASVTVSAPEGYLKPAGEREIPVTADGQIFDVGQYASVKVKLNTVTLYSGTAAPDASFGKDGDIYLVLEE